MSDLSGWRIAAACAVGTSHAKTGAPCQDAWAARVVRRGDGAEVLILAVSDGAGSAAKAEEGSRLACATLVELASAYIGGGGAVGSLTNELSVSWLTAIREKMSRVASENGLTPRDYACTLIAAVVADDEAAFLQIGDGALVVPDEVGGWCWVHWPQHGEFTNTTYFITDDTAASHLLFDVSRRRIMEVAVFTDGLERLVLHHASKTVFGAFFDQMMPAVRGSSAEGIDEPLSASLEAYLGSPAVCAKTDDDKTLVLASRCRTS
jgi:hypothetical protein